MSGVVDLLNGWGAALTVLAGVALWQATVVAVVVALVAFALRRSSPAVRYWLWQLVAIKLLLLPLGSWSIGLAWLPAVTSSTATVAVAEVESSPATPSPAPPMSEPVSVSQKPAAQSQPAQLQPRAVQRSPRSLSYAGEQTRPSPVAAQSQLSWQAWLLVCWAAVVVMQVARLGVQRRRLAQILRATTAGSGELVALVNQVAQQLRMRHSPEVAITQLDCSPFACGILRPRVVVPADLLADLDTTQLKQVVAHELAHLKRRDLVWGWITELALLLYFFHPAMLWAARRVRLERELACDQIAMQLSGRGPAEYAETLVRVLSSATVPSAFRTAAASLDGGQHQPRGQEQDQ